MKRKKKDSNLEDPMSVNMMENPISHKTTQKGYKREKTSIKKEPAG